MRSVGSQTRFINKKTVLLWIQEQLFITKNQHVLISSIIEGFVRFFTAHREENLMRCGPSRSSYCFLRRNATLEQRVFMFSTGVKSGSPRRREHSGLNFKKLLFHTEELFTELYIKLRQVCCWTKTQSETPSAHAREII